MEENNKDEVETLHQAIKLLQEENKRLYEMSGNVVLNNNKLYEFNQELVKEVDRNNKRMFKKKIDLKRIKDKYYE